MGCSPPKGCFPPKPPAPPARNGWESYSAEWFLNLGFRTNNFRRFIHFFAGHMVKQFRLRLKVNRLASSQNWVDGINIEIWSEPLQSEQGYNIATYDSLPDDNDDGRFWTPVIPGNRSLIKLHSNDNFIYVGEQGSFFHITGVDYDIDSSYQKDFVPAAPTSPYDNGVQSKFKINSNRVEAYKIRTSGFQTRNESREMGAGANYIGKLAKAFDSHFFYFIPELEGIHIPPYEIILPVCYSVYVSPLCLGLGNDVGLVLGVSKEGFILPSTERGTETGKIMPARGDTGIYYELIVPEEDRGKPVFLTVRSIVPCNYLISIKPTFPHQSLNYEMDEGLWNSEAPVIQEGSYDGAINCINPYGRQHNDFVATGQMFGPPSYLTRLENLIVLASANILASSEGYFRLGRSDIYFSTHWWLNTDIRVHNVEGRAETSPWKIHIYLNELNEPVSGAATLNHEWGHFEHGMDDEYQDILPQVDANIIDPNSIMGNGGDYNNIPWFKFCDGLSHQWVDNSDPTLADEDPAWKIFKEDLYGGAAEHGKWSRPGGCAQYHDVLHALKKLINFHYYE